MDEKRVLEIWKSCNNLYGSGVPLELAIEFAAAIEAECMEGGEPVRCNPADYCACRHENLYRHPAAPCTKCAELEKGIVHEREGYETAIAASYSADLWKEKADAAEARCLELIATGKYHASRAEAAEAKRAELEKLLRINREYANIRALKGDKK